MKLLPVVLNLALKNSMVVSILGLFFKTLARLSLFFLEKIVLAVHKNQKLYIKLVVRIVILFTLVKLNED